MFPLPQFSLVVSVLRQTEKTQESKSNGRLNKLRQPQAFLCKARANVCLFLCCLSFFQFMLLPGNNTTSNARKGSMGLQPQDAFCVHLLVEEDRGLWDGRPAGALVWAHRPQKGRLELPPGLGITERESKDSLSNPKLLPVCACRQM